MKIVLMGYMASGKSLIGKDLAKILDFNFIDLDDFIEAKEKMAITEIFNTKGEIYFRKIEHTYLKELLALQDNMVVSLGGGTPCYANNLTLLLEAKKVKTIYLQVAIPVLVARLLKEPSKRPIIEHLKTETELMEFIGKHLFERIAFYKDAEITINANNSNKEIIEKILMQLF